MRVHRQQHSFQTVYKKIKNQSNNPCACQDRTKQHIRTLQCTYLFVVTELDYWSFFFFRTKTLTYDSFTTWQQTFENKTKQKTHWKMTKAVVNLMTTTVKQNLQTYLHWSLTKIETYLISIIFKPSMPNTVIETSRIKKGRVFFFFLSRQRRMNGWRGAALGAHQWRYNHKDWLPVILNCPHLAEDWDDDSIFYEIQKDP